MPIDEARSAPDQSVVRTAELLDRADAAAAAGDVVQACLMTRRAAAVQPHDPRLPGAVEVRARLRWTTGDVAARARGLDPGTLRGRIAAALVRLGGCATLEQIAEEVAERIEEAEEARVQALHMLGRDVVLSWPDFPAAATIRNELDLMLLEGEARRTRQLAFWRGELWSPPSPEARHHAPESTIREQIR